MKLICFILILAGAFALNDAAISPEEQQQVLRDQLKLEELKRLALNRNLDSVGCSASLLQELTEIIGTYNHQMIICNKTREDEVAALNEAALKQIDGFSASMQGTCDTLNGCGLNKVPMEGLSCYIDKSTESARIMTSVSSQAATTRTQLQGSITSANNKQETCEKEAFGEYSIKSNESNDKFNACVNAKSVEGEPTKPTQAPTRPTPVEPQTIAGRPIVQVVRF